jgi:hydroxyacylglutathione hydrolase
MIVKQINSGYDNNFTYLVIDEETKEAAVIDPSMDVSQVLKEIKEFKVKYIINTHHHQDHIMGNKKIYSETKAKIIQHGESPLKHDISVGDNQEIKLGNLILKFLHTPGHSKDHICILVENKLFTGDLLFVGNIGGTGSYFEGSDHEQEMESLQKIMKLPGNIEIYPGHDYGDKPTSTIKHEKETNPFLKTIC